MTTPKHTPEPWAYNENTHRVWANTHESEKYNHNDAIICELSHYTVADREAAANAARIVECVNAMEGKPNPAEYVQRATELAAKYNEQLIEIADLKAQREEAFKIIDWVSDTIFVNSDMDTPIWVEEIRTKLKHI